MQKTFNIFITAEGVFGNEANPESRYGSLETALSLSVWDEAVTGRFLGLVERQNVHGVKCHEVVRGNTAEAESYSNPGRLVIFF